MYKQYLLWKSMLLNYIYCVSKQRTNKYILSWMYVCFLGQSFVSDEEWGLSKSCPNQECLSPFVSFCHNALLRPISRTFLNYLIRLICILYRGVEVFSPIIFSILPPYSGLLANRSDFTLTLKISEWYIGDGWVALDC